MPGPGGREAIPTRSTTTPGIPRTANCGRRRSWCPWSITAAAWTVLLTKRTEHLSNHAGQISFPGGRVDDGDDGPEHTALRETEEEVGIDRSRIEIVSHLDDYVVGTGFLVRPVVGFIEPPIDVDKHDHEVDEVFEAPLEFLIDPENVERHHREFNGRVRHFFAITYRDYYIWGATAGMLCNLAERLARRVIN